MHPQPLAILLPLLALLTFLASTQAQHTGGFLNTMPTCWQSSFKTSFPSCPKQEASDSAAACVCSSASSNITSFASFIQTVSLSCNDETNPESMTAPFEAFVTACNTLGHPLQGKEVKSADLSAVAASATSGLSALNTAASSVTATSSAAKSTPTDKSGKGKDGSPMDVANLANKQRARSMLGLTIGILAGVVWF